MVVVVVVGGGGEKRRWMRVDGCGRVVVSVDAVVVDGGSRVGVGVGVMAGIDVLTLSVG